MTKFSDSWKIKAFYNKQWNFINAGKTQCIKYRKKKKIRWDENRKSWTGDKKIQWKIIKLEESFPNWRKNKVYQRSR